MARIVDRIAALTVGIIAVLDALGAEDPCLQINKPNVFLPTTANISGQPSPRFTAATYEGELLQHIAPPGELCYPVQFVQGYFFRDFEEKRRTS